jgi:hypothetical protein
MEIFGCSAENSTRRLMWMQSMTVTSSPVFPLGLEDFLLLRKEYDIADKVAKDVRAFVQMAGIPAVNEMRYAGYHLLNCVSPMNSSVDLQAELTRAINHCKRATYEASEAGILTAFDKITAFKDDYRGVVISQVVKDWSEILLLCDTANDRLTAAREAGEDKMPDHIDFKSTFDRLVAICRKLDHARDEMNTLVRQEQTAARRFMLTLVIGLGGVVATVIIALGA